MSMKDKLTPDQISDINLISTMDRIHDIFIKSFNAALPKLENSQLQRLAYFTAFKRQVWELVFPKADTDKDKLNEKFEEYFDIISKYIVTGGNPTEMVAAATEYIRQLKIHITQFEDLTDIVGNKAFTKLMSNDIKIKFITFIKEYVNDDNFMSDPDPKRSLIQAMKELNITWPVIEGGTNWMVPTDLYGVSGIPHILVIASDTIVARGLQGDELAALVDRLVGSEQK